jgi:cytochrome c oxidase subunit II
MQSMLSGAGTDAALITGLWWYFFAVCAVVFVVVLILTYRAVVAPHSEVTADADATRTRYVAGGAFVSALILVTIFIASVSVGRATVSGDPDALTIEIIGHQWWWEVRYLDPSPYRMVPTANELHLPAGRRVRLLLTSSDVIHSFWIPALGGKIDMFPDRTNVLWLEPKEPGVYRGQCAEFCGMQHAKMALVAVVHEPAAFEAWLQRERMPAAPPADARAQRGHDAFMSSSCVLCHRIRGTEAMAMLGPELTHLGRRRTLAAGTLPNNRANLTAWLIDPQHLKPGSHMPPTNLDADVLHDIVHYLERLR